MEHHQIKYGDRVFDASEYQDAIFDAVVHDSCNILISAAAGASKTTTMIKCMELIDRSQKILYVAFNKEIVESIKSKIEGLYNVNVSTFHSLGYRMLRRHLGITPQIADFKYSSYIQQNLEVLSENADQFIGMRSGRREKYASTVMELVNMARYHMLFRPAEIKEKADAMGITVISDEHAVSARVLSWGRANTDTIDYTDMIWLPNVLNFYDRSFMYDWVMVDESQDTSVTEQMMVSKCFGRGCRFICCGDKKQQINIWCGADEEALKKFSEIANTVEFELPVSYRCPVAVTRLAQEYSPMMKHAEWAEEGAVYYDADISDPEDGDMVLCRMTAPLVSLYYSYMDMGVKSYMKGSSDVLSRYVSLVENTDSDIVNGGSSEEGTVMHELYERLLGMIAGIMKKHGIDDGEAMKSMEVATMYDSIQALMVMSRGIALKYELIDRIREVFGGEEGGGIMLSTVHRAKGLEADNVYILCPSMLPNPFAKLPWEIETERNLTYVAYTRAKKTLSFISEEDTPSESVVKMKDMIRMIRDTFGYGEDYTPNGQDIFGLLTKKKPASDSGAAGQKGHGSKMKSRIGRFLS